MLQAQFTFWGTFKNKRSEAMYLQHSRYEMVRRNRLAFLISGIGFGLVVISDFIKLGFSQETLMTSIIRGIHLIGSLFLYFYFAKKQSVRKLTVLSFIWFMYYVIMINALVYFLNPDKELDMIDSFTMPFCTLLYYIFLQIPVFSLLLGGITTSIIFLLMVFFQIKTSLDGFIVLAILLFIINFVGFYIPRMQGTLKRMDFFKNKTIHDLYKTLKKETEDRVVAQEKLETAYNEMNDSIKYARQIQVAMLPDQSAFSKLGFESFVYHQPLNLLSGDYYWCHSDEQCVYIAVADCTGHGIPGALMSMLGISSLNEIVKNKGLQPPNEILNHLRSEIIYLLHQNEVDSSSRDGMDMALCCIDKNSMTLHFAGALNNIFHIRGSVLTELKGDKMPIGYFYGKNHSFTLQSMELQPDDLIYMSTDGYFDQFGGVHSKRFSSRKFKQLLLDMSQFSLEQQKIAIDNTMQVWKSDYEQVDDILVVGLKV